MFYRFLAPALFALVLIVGVPAPADAQQNQRPAYSAEDRQIILEIQNYLNSMNTVQASITDRTEGESDVFQGVLAFKRPYKMRLEYKKPFPYLLLADGKRVIYHDIELDQVTYGSLKDIPFSFLLGPQIDLLSSQYSLTVREQGNRYMLRVIQPQKEAPPLTFFFRKQPIELIEWAFQTEDGKAHLVQFDNIAVNIGLLDSLFQFKRPQFNKPRNYIPQ